MHVRIRRFPIVAAVVGALLALGALGIVYGSWSQAFNINASVQTASIRVKWDTPTPSCGDHEQTKDIATTKRQVVNGKFIVQVNNGYPGYVAKCNQSLRNNGKLPVRIGSISIKPGGDLNPATCTTASDPNTGSVSLSCPELEVEFIDGLGQQLNQGVATGSVMNIRVLKGAEQAKNYTFQVQICVEPFNTNQCETKSGNGL